MKAISLWQPWATLVVIGIKTYETRSWLPNNYRGPLAIHAARRWTVEQAEFAQHLIATYPNVADLFQALRVRELPLGQIVGTVMLTECVSTTTALNRDLSEVEIACGDFSPNRWAWKLASPQYFDPPIPCKGRQGIFTWNQC